MSTNSGIDGGSCVCKKDDGWRRAVCVFVWVVCWFCFVGFLVGWLVRRFDG